MLAPFNVNRSSFSQLFWSAIYEKNDFYIDSFLKSIAEVTPQLESNRMTATYNTGSVGMSTALNVALLARYFKPRVVAEIGTFIGRTTYSLALGCDSVGTLKTEIHTCDMSNNIQLSFNTRTKIHQYPNTSSEVMLSQLRGKGVYPDLSLIDGRLSIKDIGIMLDLKGKEGIFLLDDFEGIEKGVLNSLNLLNHLHDSHILIYPKVNEPYERSSFFSQSLLAVLLPKGLIKFVAQ